ncbi:hypothetical protein Tco_1202590 [Tanacetum coccineum]
MVEHSTPKEALRQHWYMLQLRYKRVRIVLWIMVHRSMLNIAKKSYKGSSNALDVRYIPILKRRLIPLGQLDEEGYQVGFGDQQWKVTKGSLVVAHGNKCESLYMVEDWYEHLSFQRQCSRYTEGRCLLLDWSKFIQKAMALRDREPNLKLRFSYIYCINRGSPTMIQLSKAAIGFTKMVPETSLQFGVAERLSRTFRAESTGIHVEAPKMLWADSVSTAYLIYHIPYVLIGLHIPEEEWRGRDISLTHLKAAAQIKCDTAFEIRRVTKLSKAEILHFWTRFMKPENDSIVTKHELSSKITQTLGGSSDTSEGSENSGSFRIVCGCSGLKKIRMAGKGSDMAEFNKPKWQLSLVFKMKDICSEKQVLCYVLTVGVTIVEWESRLQKSITMVLIFVEDSWNKEPCNDVHQVGDEREVKVLHRFNWPLSILITEDGVLPERVQRVPYVQRHRKVRALALLKGRKVRVVALLKGMWFEVYRDYLRRRVVK